MKCNKRLKYNNYVAFSHFHGTAVNNSGLVILITAYRHYNWIYLKSILLALILGGIGIGTNHFIHYLQVHQIVNLIGALENYLLVIAWIIGWKIEAKRQDE